METLYYSCCIQEKTIDSDMNRHHLFFLTFTILLLSAISVLAQENNDKHKKKREKKYQTPKVGEIAPPFKLKSLDGKSETELVNFTGQRPVVLFFGSYT